MSKIRCIILLAITAFAAFPVRAMSSLGQTRDPRLDATATSVASPSDVDGLVQAGDQFYSDFDFRSALEAYEQALRIFQKSGDRAGAVAVLIKIGDIYLDLGQDQLALDYYQASWPEGEARTVGPVGIAYIHLGDLQKAFQFSRQALSQKKMAGDKRGEATYLNNIGIIYSQTGDYLEALKYFQEALVLCRQVEDPELESVILNSIGDTYIYQGEYQNSLDYLFQALAIREDLHNPIRTTNTLNTIGKVYTILGNYEEALDYYLQAITESDKVEYRLGESQANNGIGMILERIGRNQEAVLFFQQSLTAVHELGGNMEGEAALLNNLGFAYYELGDYAKAQEYYAQALAIYRKIGNRFGETIILTNIGGIYNDLGNHQKALEYHQQALTYSQAIGYTAGKVNISANIGMVYEEEGDYQKAFDYYSQAITVLEEIREKLTAEELRTIPVYGTTSIYEHAIFALLKLDRPIDAFNYAERARARTFLDFLGNQRVNPKGSENPKLVEEEKQLASEISALEVKLRQMWGTLTVATSTEEIENLNSALETKRKDYQDVLLQLQITNPEYAALISVTPLDLEEVQDMLHTQAPDAIFVNYFVGTAETAIFVVSKDSFFVQTISVSKYEISVQVQQLREQMKEDPILPDAWQDSAQILYNWLIAPVQEHLDNTNSKMLTQLGIIPHDVLHYLPFNLLYDGKKIALENHSIFYAPSLSSMKFIFEKSHTQSDTLLAMASPSIPPYPYLNYAVKESQTIASLYNSQAVIETFATESYLKRHAQEYELIHIAAHSDYVSDRPLFSAILLSADESEDGRLETHEIFNLDLSQANLVVLSACETHLSKLNSGDEMVGLERAFIRAGTPSLISTLWSVDDAATAVLMESFYTHLKAGLSKGEALRLAQIETRAQYPEPYYWAGFILVGDYGESQDNLNESQIQIQIDHWILVAASIIIVLIMLFWRQRRGSFFKSVP